ncbi:MAG: hypothetical protein CMP10_12480 [Zetaproteobacteria bacterium]|nr:hypothetical protein [Pseudobdellovibrionaceae bacterium]
MLKKQIDFINNYSIDDQLYWRVNQLYTDKEYEIQWRRDEAAPWRYRAVKDETWQEATNQQIITDLSKLNIDLVHFEAGIRGCILQQVIFADMICKKAKSLLGSEAIEKAFADNQAFMNEIINTISDLTKSKKPATDNPKPFLQLVQSNMKPLN